MTRCKCRLFNYVTSDVLYCDYVCIRIIYSSLRTDHLVWSLICVWSDFQCNSLTILAPVPKVAASTLASVLLHTLASVLALVLTDACKDE